MFEGELLEQLGRIPSRECGRLSRFCRVG